MSPQCHRGMHRCFLRASSRIKQMKAIEITEFGAPDVLKLGERPMPEPKAGEVLIKVAASGVNRPDVFQRKGGYAPPPGASDLPGLEVAGEIVRGDFDPKQNPDRKSVCRG